MLTEIDVALDDGRTVHAYDTGGADRLAVVWHHGTPNIGAPPAPLFDDADRLGLRWVGFDRPGYGGSTPLPAPVLLLHGGRDAIVPAEHSAWLARRCPAAELRLAPDDGHISILAGAPAALERLRAQGPGA
jgi:pimeloyl-ACP methyl ester carboxylesterase